MDYSNNVDAMDIVDWLDIEEEAAEQPRKRKSFKQRADPFQLSDSEFKYKYRFSKPYARYIIDLISDDIKQDKRGGGVSQELQVLTALRTWARQEVQDDSADIHGLSQQSVTNICRRVALALASKANRFIAMPQSIAEQERLIAGFRSVCGFRNVIGAIDCTHIRIKKVGGNSGQYYINRKGFSSMNVQVVCDSSLRIRDIVARWRGSSHDARIFRESRIKERFECGEFTGRLIGDSGYALTTYLFTPVQNPASPREEAYNRAHIQTRNAVERCFGVWKQRFRCLLSGFTVSLPHVKLYTVALAVLHNIAIDMGEELNPIPHIERPQMDTHVVEAPQTDQYGRAARTLFIESYF